MPTVNASAATPARAAGWRRGCARRRSRRRRRAPWALVQPGRVVSCRRRDGCSRRAAPLTSPPPAPTAPPSPCAARAIRVVADPPSDTFPRRATTCAADAVCLHLGVVVRGADDQPSRCRHTGDERWRATSSRRPRRSGWASERVPTRRTSCVRQVAADASAGTDHDGPVGAGASVPGRRHGQVWPAAGAASAVRPMVSGAGCPVPMPRRRRSSRR